MGSDLTFNSNKNTYVSQSGESHLLKRHTLEGTMKFTPQANYMSGGNPLVIYSACDHTC